MLIKQERKQRPNQRSSRLHHRNLASNILLLLPTVPCVILPPRSQSQCQLWKRIPSHSKTWVPLPKWLKCSPNAHLIHQRPPPFPAITEIKTWKNRRPDCRQNSTTYFTLGVQSLRISSGLLKTARLMGSTRWWRTSTPPTGTRPQLPA